MGRTQVHTEVWWGNLGEGDHIEDQVVYEKIILRWIFMKFVEGHGLDLFGSWYREVALHCKCGKKNIRVP